MPVVKNSHKWDFQQVKVNHQCFLKVFNTVNCFTAIILKHIIVEEFVENNGEFEALFDSWQ